MDILPLLCLMSGRTMTAGYVASLKRCQAQIKKNPVSSQTPHGVTDFLNVAFPSIDPFLVLHRDVKIGHCDKSTAGTRDKHECTWLEERKWLVIYNLKEILVTVPFTINMISSRAYFPSLEYFIHLHNAFQCQCLIPRRSTLISMIWHLQLLVTLARGESPSLPTFWNDGGRRDCAGRPPDGVMLSSRRQLIKNLWLPVLSPAAPSTYWSSKGEAPKTNPLPYLKCHMGSQ